MRPERLQDLPDFSDPPVIQTVLSVQFEPLAELRTAYLGLYWAANKNRYPKTEERPELSPIIERFPDHPKMEFGIQLETLEAPPTPRIWFMSETGTELIQVQRDRFIKNWRKGGTGAHYPRYERVRETFDEEFAAFASFSQDQSLGNISITQCEVSYVNHIVSGEGWKTHADVDQIFTVFNQPIGDPPGRMEDLTCQARFVINLSLIHI